jgi:hypothetical protein
MCLHFYLNADILFSHIPEANSRSQPLQSVQPEPVATCTNICIFSSHSLLYILHQFIDILRSYLSINSSVSDFYVYIHMYVCYDYKNIQIKNVSIHFITIK